MLPMITYNQPAPDADDMPLRDAIMEDKLWGGMRRMSKTDPGMADLAEKMITYYHLKKDHVKG